MTVPGRQDDIVSKYQTRSITFIREQEGFDIRKQADGLSISDGVGIARAVSSPHRAFISDLAGADRSQHVFEQLSVRVAQIDGGVACLVAVPAGQGDGPVCIDQARNVGCLTAI